MELPIAEDLRDHEAMYSRRPRSPAPLPPPANPPTLADDAVQSSVSSAPIAYTQRTRNAVEAAEAVIMAMPQLRSRVYDGVWGSGPWRGEGPPPVIKDISEAEWALFNARLLSADRTAQLSRVREAFLQAYYIDSYVPPGDRRSAFRPRSRAGLRGDHVRCSRSSSSVDLFRHS